MIKSVLSIPLANVTKIWQQCFHKSHKQIIECPYCVAIHRTGRMLMDVYVSLALSFKSLYIHSAQRTAVFFCPQSYISVTEV